MSLTKEDPSLAASRLAQDDRGFRLLRRAGFAGAPRNDGGVDSRFRGNDSKTATS